MSVSLSKYPLILCLLLFIVKAFPQPVPIGKTKMVVSDPERDHRKIRLQIFYPADSSGRDVPVSSVLRGKFPYICFGHGYLMSVRNYRNLWTAVVPWGYIFIYVKKERGLAPSHLEMARDMHYITTHFHRQAKDSGSLFYNRIAPNSVLMGHSMGGGAAVLAAAFRGSPAKALCALAAYNTRPPAVKAAKKISIPVILFAGSNDCITPPRQHQFPLYDSLNSREKILINITGGSHCQMANRSIACKLAEAFCPSGPGISTREQHNLIRRFLIPWLDFHLKNQPEAGAKFDSLIVSESAIQYRRSWSLKNNSPERQKSTF